MPLSLRERTARLALLAVFVFGAGCGKQSPPKAPNQAEANRLDSPSVRQGGVVGVNLLECDAGSGFNALLDDSVVVPTFATVASAGIPAAGELPWLADERFLNAITHHQTPILMAAFKSVLSEPIGHEAHNIALAAERISGSVVPPGGVFSQNSILGPYDASNGYLAGPNYVNGNVVLDVGGGVCKIATMLYNLTVLSNLPVVYRRPHSMIVPYVPPGQDATVSFSAEVDYRFRNDTDAPILIWARKTGSGLYMAFYGREAPPQVRWQHEILSHVRATTVYRYNPELNVGEEHVVSPGFDGYVVRSWAEVTYPDGRREQRPLGVSSYRMSPRVIERGPRPAGGGGGSGA